MSPGGLLPRTPASLPVEAPPRPFPVSPPTQTLTNNLKCKFVQAFLTGERMNKIIDSCPVFLPLLNISCFHVVLI